jgi:hypothetical protein
MMPKKRCYQCGSASLVHVTTYKYYCESCGALGEPITKRGLILEMLFSVFLIILTTTIISFGFSISLFLGSLALMGQCFPLLLSLGELQEALDDYDMIKRRAH